MLHALDVIYLVLQEVVEEWDWGLQGSQDPAHLRSLVMLSEEVASQDGPLQQSVVVVANPAVPAEWVQVQD
jgi:hypothetical protein